MMMVSTWCLGWFLILGRTPGDDPALLTTAEKSNYTATSLHADVVALGERLAQRSPRVRLATLGTSNQGRALPLWIVADPPIANVAAARTSGKLIVLAFGNIHAGEVCGKEALQILARELTGGVKEPLLDHLVILLAPIFNADGNEQIDPRHRPGQDGPAQGMGIRANAQGLDLNRDFVKLESPEVRALVRLLNEWDPLVIIDTHTTNGSLHRYLITYDGPRYPAADGALIRFARDEMLPSISRELEARKGFKSYFYGNFEANATRWVSYPATPRFGIPYFGVRQRLGILSESYAYAPFKDRVLGTRDFVRAVFDYCAAHRDTVRRLTQADPNNRGTAAVDQAAEIAIRTEAAPMKMAVSIAGYAEQTKGDKPAGATPRDYPVEPWLMIRPTLSVKPPAAYLVPAGCANVLENLRRHGVLVKELREDIELDVEAYRVNRVVQAARAFQGHRLRTLEVTGRREARRIPAGTFVVPTDQSLGRLAVILLEPQSEDGLATWNFFDALLAAGKDFPVLRLVGRPPILTTESRLLSETPDAVLETTPETLARGPQPGLEGGAIQGMVWLDDGAHYLERRGDQLLKVHAESGRTEPFFDPAKVAAAFAKVPAMGEELAKRKLQAGEYRLDKIRESMLLEKDRDLFHAKLDGSTAARLTQTPDEEELAELSPDGKWVAFVRGNNLFVVDVAAQLEKQLTKDGSAIVLNGKADWVYFEEVYNRRYKGFWWSPDSRRLAFLRYDDMPVNTFTVVNALTPRQQLEPTRYPKAGDPNPHVTLHVADVGNGQVTPMNLPNYQVNQHIIMRVTWRPDSQAVWAYVQDRAQKWLDVTQAPTTGAPAVVLFRETTKAWVNDPGEPHFLSDGSFLFASERTGYRHLFHYAPDGTLKKQLSDGPWEVRDVRLVAEAAAAVFLEGTKDSDLAEHLYRIALADGGIERLTREPGSHAANVSPKGNFFIDTYSSMQTPPKVALRKTDGALVRNLDTNPRMGRGRGAGAKPELTRIKLSDGFEINAVITKPAKFDPNLKYPVWLVTYAGPHMPTIVDSWRGGGMQDQMIANLGVIVFRCDPRSASGKGAIATWTCYRQLGVQELKDLEEAVDWICKFPYVDPQRIGISGHSYGGFMTAFALTHSKKFCAGIAGAPVTDWHNYDSIYTERYMDTPQNNPEGYQKTSVVKAAGNLHGRLLLLHGYIDDNVHVQNTIQLAHELQRANRDFEMMLYPTARHGIFGAHYSRLMNDFIRRSLKLEPVAKP